MEPKYCADKVIGFVGMQFPNFKWYFPCQANTANTCHLDATVSSNLLGGRTRFSQPGTGDVDVVLLARYTSRAVPGC